LTQYEVWGSDTGEYYYITNQLASDGYIETEYDGWGFGYPHFPGLFYLSGASHFLTGMDVLWSLTVIIPIAASLSVFVVFLISRMLFKNDAAGLLASAFVAVAMPSVFATSHPMPGSLGDLLLFSSVLFLIASLKNNKFIPLLVLSALALTITHHLSSYFLFTMIFGGLFVAGIIGNKDKREIKLSWAFLLLFLSMLALFWVIGAKPFSERVISMAFDLPFWIVLSLGFIVLFVVYFLIWIRRRISWCYKPKFPKSYRTIVLFIVLLCIIFFVLGFLVLVKVPGTEVQLTPETVLLFTPLVVLLAFTSVGAGYIKMYKHGMVVFGWIFALLASLFLAIFTSNRVLLTYRHPQYFMLPLALAVGLGIVMLIDSITNDQRNFKKGLSVGLVIVLLGLTSLSAYPPTEVMGGFQEGTSEAEMQGVAWAKNSLEEGATVATDHRMSSMLFGFGGLNATWDEAYKTLHAPSYEECEDEIESISIPSGEKSINYILLDDEIKEGVALLQWENAKAMSQKAQDKFEKYPFIKLYEANGVEVYGMVR
jgi:hypothetical protein